jgi:hypothetical protein
MLLVDNKPHCPKDSNPPVRVSAQHDKWRETHENVLSPAGALFTETKAHASERQHGGNLSGGDAAIFRLLAAVELIESDLWGQYNELGVRPRESHK